MLRRLLSIVVLAAFLGTSAGQFPQVYAQGVLDLPIPGTMVKTSEAFTPALVRGMVIHPEDPLRLDFIVDPGEAKLQGKEFSAECQRMVNYFLASLTIPQQDLWVNLSPVEKNRIVPDTLIQTELGRDLLSMDYMLKQLTASLVYPEEKLGQEFWAKVYAQAKERFGTTDIPVAAFNKVWIVPAKASVYEKGNSAYITKIHLKVMLESDYLVKDKQSAVVRDEQSEMSKQLLREMIVPIIEKEVNEGKNYAQLRQMVYALTLAQWYQDVFKQKLLNQEYSAQNKIAGIDVSSPKNKQLIYQRYLEAYKKGVFNYIKEEAGPVPNSVIPKKFFSGGFHVEIQRDRALMSEVGNPQSNLLLGVNLNPVAGSDEAMVAGGLEEPYAQWNDLSRPITMLEELRGLFTGNILDEDRFSIFMDKYARQVAAQPNYPVQSSWPVLKAIVLLNKEQEAAVVAAVKKKYATAQLTRLGNAILLMNNSFLDGSQLREWASKEAPHLQGRRIYMTAAEIHYQEGGLGPVMEFHGKGAHDLGADVAYVELAYATRQDRGNKDGTDLLDYHEVGITDLVDNYDTFPVRVGEEDVKVSVAKGKDANGVTTYLVKDVQPDGKSKYTKMLYKYNTAQNPISQEQSMAFLNVAIAEFIAREEARRFKTRGAGFKAAIVYSNDGQLAPLQAVLESRTGQYTSDIQEALKGIKFTFTTHTYANRGRNNDVNWGIKTFLMHMMKISQRFVNAFRGGSPFGQQWVDYTSGAVNLADWVGGVSDKHRDDVGPLDPNSKVVAVTNGAVPEIMGANYQRVYRRLFPQGDYQRPTANQVAQVKRVLKEELNTLKVKTANGGTVEVDLDKPTIGFSRRLVGVKAGRDRAFTDANIWRLVELGYNVVLAGRNQKTDESEAIAADLKRLEREINTAIQRNPQQYKGRFFFVEAFTDKEKKAFLGAFNIQVQDSDNHTGAAEYTEEDVTASGGYQAGATFREGIILDQGIKLNMIQQGGVWNVEQPDAGNTLAPQEDTAKSWVETVYEPMMRLWEKGAEQFYAGAAKSPSINRIMNYLITSSVYLLEWEKMAARHEQEDIFDAKLLKEVQSISKEDTKTILNQGRNAIDKPFAFSVLGVGEQTAANMGLDGFIQKKEEIERIFGFDALLGYFKEKDFQKYLAELFRGTVLENVFNQFLKELEKSPASTLQQYDRFGRFITSAKDVLVAKDQALTSTGGIDLRQVTIGREGRLMADVIQRSSMEKVLLNAAGVRGNIVTITPIGKMSELLDAVK